MYDGTLSGPPVRTFVDSYASHNFMSVDNARQLGIMVKKLQDIEVELGDSSKTAVVGDVEASLNIRGFITQKKILLIQMKETEGVPVLILGRPWLKEHNPGID